VSFTQSWLWVAMAVVTCSPLFAACFSPWSLVSACDFEPMFGRAKLWFACSCCLDWLHVVHHAFFAPNVAQVRGGRRCCRKANAAALHGYSTCLFSGFT
jgi:hypothetical protein